MTEQPEVHDECFRWWREGKTVHLRHVAHESQPSLELHLPKGVAADWPTSPVPTDHLHFDTPGAGGRE